MVKLRITIVAAVVTVSMMTCAFAQGRTAPTVSRGNHLLAICATSYDPYREPLTVLRSCGDTILRLRRVTPLPGGGKAYDYGAYTQLMPPPHFNPLKASDRQLREYGLPTRQRLGSLWYPFVSHMRHFVKPLPYMVSLPAAPKTTPRPLDIVSPNWSGYAATAGHSYNGAVSGFYEPDFTSSRCNTTAFSQWAGIGGLTSPLNLGQTGTIFGFPGLGAHQGWIETSEGGVLSPPVGINIYATPDQKFDAGTLWDSSTSKYDYDMANEYTGAAWSGTSRVVSSVDLSSAEVIAERPTINGGLPGLTSYGNFLVTHPAVTWGSTGSAYFSALLANNDAAAVNMYDRAGNIMSAPGPVNATTGDFTNYYYHCN